MNSIRYIRTIAFITLATLLAGCSSRGISRSNMEQYATIYYATVVDVEEIEFDSQAGEAAAIGALDGAINARYYDTDTMIASAIVHAFFYSVVTVIAEGGNTGYTYKVRDMQGDIYSVITDRKGITVGDCVEIMESEKVSIAKVSKSHCFSDIQKPTNP